MAKLSVELNRYFFEEHRSSDIKLIDILELAGERVFGFLFVILALPSALPVPAPGYSIPFGILVGKLNENNRVYMCIVCVQAEILVFRH